MTTNTTTTNDDNTPAGYLAPCLGHEPCEHCGSMAPVHARADEPDYRETVCSCVGLDAGCDDCARSYGPHARCRCYDAYDAACEARSYGDDDTGQRIVDRACYHLSNTSTRDLQLQADTDAALALLDEVR